MTAGTELKEPVAASAGGVLGNRDFVKLWTGESVSLVGTQITQLALPLVAILTLHASVFQVGLLNASRYAPVVVFSLFAGVWLDRRRRRPVLVGADLACAAFIGLVPLCSVLGVLSFWVLCAAALLAGSAQVFFDIGALAYLPGLVERPHLAAANSKMQISYSVAGIGGPSLAGLLIGLLTAPITLSADAFSYLFSAVMLLRIRKPESDPRGGGGQPAAAAPSWRAAVAEGLHTVFGNRMLRPLLAQSCTFNFCFNALLTIFVVYAIRRLGLSSFQLGCVIGAGAVAGYQGARLGPDARCHPAWHLPRPPDAARSRPRVSGDLARPRTLPGRVRHLRRPLQHRHGNAAAGGHPEPPARPDERRSPAPPWH